MIVINNLIKEYSGILDIFSKIIILRFFYTSFTIFFLYNLPIIFSYRLLLNGEQTRLKTLVYSLFNIFYKSPMYIALYFYVNKSLKKILSQYRGEHSPTHIFSKILITITYCAIYMFYYLSEGLTTIIPMTLLYSLYISELSYNFIDNLEYKFKNSITFYNSNYLFFGFLGAVYSCIEYFYLLSHDLEILGLFIYILLCFPFLIAYKYQNNPDSYNLFYIPENILISLT